jgi:DNA-binding transcriptional ArsR family regulator
MLTSLGKNQPDRGRRKSRHTDDVFYAVADPTRRALLDLLATGDKPVNTLAEQFEMSRPAISQHLAVLMRTRLVRARRVGRERVYHLEPKPLQEIDDWLGLYERFWKQKLERLGEYLRKKS